MLFHAEGHLGLITLNRSTALNALTLPMIVSIQHFLTECLVDDNIHAVVIKAMPGKAFCAGGDVRFLYDAHPHHHNDQMQFFWHEYRLNHFIHQYQKPYVALMDGYTMGGGVGVSLHGSHRVASERFVFSMPETGIGFFPDIGASFLLSRLKGAYGQYLGLTGQRVSSVEAKALGLVDTVISHTLFPEVLDALLRADLSEDAHCAVSSCLSDFVSAVEIGDDLTHQSVIDHCFGRLTVEDILVALNDDASDWHRETVALLSAKSPLSLKVTLKQMQKARHLDMAQCVTMDYCLVGHFMRGHDFYEGVRALLVDKDQTPHWIPATLKDAANPLVASYFECGQPDLPLLR